MLSVSNKQGSHVQPSNMNSLLDQTQVATTSLDRTNGRTQRFRTDATAHSNERWKELWKRKRSNLISEALQEIHLRDAQNEKTACLQVFKCPSGNLCFEFFKKYKHQDLPRNCTIQVHEENMNVAGIPSSALTTVETLSTLHPRKGCIFILDPQPKSRLVFLEVAFQELPLLEFL